MRESVPECFSRPISSGPITVSEVSLNCWIHSFTQLVEVGK